MPVSEIYTHRKLLRAFVVRDLRTRYVGSSLGVFWSVVHPLIMLGIYIVVFSTIVRGGSFRVHGQVAGYALFLCPAILAWNWFSESIINACGSITGNAPLIKKIVFPSAILPVAPLLSAFIPFLVTLLVFLVFAAIMNAFSFRTLLILPFVFALQAVVTIGPAYLFSSLNVFARDTAPLVSALLQVLFWSSPIVYTEETLTTPFPWLKFWFELNPVAHLVGAYRDAIIAHRLPAFGSVMYLLFCSILAYHFGRALFVRGRRRFVDEV